MPPLPLNLLSFDVNFLRKEAAPICPGLALTSVSSGFEVWEVLMAGFGLVTFVPFNGISGAHGKIIFSLIMKPAEGLNLYKLKMIDQDEKYQLQRDIRSVTFNVKNHASVYPNPTIGHLNITGLSGNGNHQSVYLQERYSWRWMQRSTGRYEPDRVQCEENLFLHITTYVDGRGKSSR